MSEAENSFMGSEPERQTGGPVSYDPNKPGQEQHGKCPTCGGPASRGTNQ